MGEPTTRSAHATTGTGSGTFTFGTGDVFSVDVENIGQQITKLPGDETKDHVKDTFCGLGWRGNDFIHGGVSVQTAYTVAANQYINIQRLIHAGATQFIVPNLPPLGLIPRINGDPSTAALVNLVVAYYNGLLNLDIQLLLRTNHQKHLPDSTTRCVRPVQKNCCRALEVLAVKCDWQFTRCRGKSRHLFILGHLHPTTRGHNILAINARRLAQQLHERGQE